MGSVWHRVFLTAVSETIEASTTAGGPRVSHPRGRLKDAKEMQMVTTGWCGEEPDAGPALPVTNFILSQRAAPAGPVTLEQAVTRVLHRAERPGWHDAEPEREDPDEKAAALVTRGYVPGLVTELSRRLGDVEAEAEAEREKIEKGARRAARIHQAHQAGRFDAFAVMRAMDFDEGDQGRVRLLERHAASLRAQIADAMEAISPPERRAPDALEAASRHAHQVFVEATRQRFAEAQAGRPEPRPFASVSRGAGRSTEHTGPDCPVCAEGRRRDAARDREDYAAVYGEIAR
jgi:hypothetical protein